MTARKSPLASRPSLFRRTDDGVPELAEHSDVQTSEQGDGSPAEHLDRQTLKHSDVPRRIKRTFHLEPEVVLLLSEVQVADQRRTGHKPELSELVSEAIRQLGERRLAPS